jgi:hypothetical protein
MKKLAIFVEGQTEQLFVCKLLKEIAGNKLSLEVRKAAGGCRIPRIAVIEIQDPITSDTKFYVLIHNSSNDDRVTSDIRDQHSSLQSNGYEMIIGLRDVYPKSYADIPLMEMGSRFAFRGFTIPAQVVLAIMEIESWFLAEWNHFAKVSPILTPEEISRDLGFNPKIDNMELRSHPAEDLDNIYKIANLRYKKTENQVHRIISNLDYEFLYLNLINRVTSLGKFVGLIDAFLT